MNSLTFLSLFSLFSLVVSHGYLYYPPPRGIQKEGYQVDDLKSPNRKGLCRGEPVGQITPVTPGGKVTLKFHITAPHKGPCAVYLLDENLKNSREIAKKMDCAAPGKAEPWTISLPNGVSGHMVLRWTWLGQHVSPAEPYEQCIDVNFGGNGGSTENYQPEQPSNENYQPEEEKPSRRPTEKPTGQPNYKPKKNNDENRVMSNSQEQQNDNSEEQPKESYNGQESNDEPKESYDGKENDDKPTYTSQKEGSDGKCENGKFECRGQQFAQCSNGEWFVTPCGEGTLCQPTPEGSIICARAQQL